MLTVRARLEYSAEFGQMLIVDTPPHLLAREDWYQVAVRVAEGDDIQDRIALALEPLIPTLAAALAGRIKEN